MKIEEVREVLATLDDELLNLYDRINQANKKVTKKYKKLADEVSEIHDKMTETLSKVNTTLNTQIQNGGSTPAPHIIFGGDLKEAIQYIEAQTDSTEFVLVREDYVLGAYDNGRDLYSMVYLGSRSKVLMQFELYEKDYLGDYHQNATISADDLFKTWVVVPREDYEEYLEYLQTVDEDSLN